MIPTIPIVIIVFALFTLWAFHKYRTAVYARYDDILMGAVGMIVLFAAFIAIATIINAAQHIEDTMTQAGYRETQVEIVDGEVRFRNESGQHCRAYVEAVGESGFSFRNGPWCNDVVAVKPQ